MCVRTCVVPSTYRTRSFQSVPCTVAKFSVLLLRSGNVKNFVFTSPSDGATAVRTRMRPTRTCILRVHGLPVRVHTHVRISAYTKNRSMTPIDSPCPVASSANVETYFRSITFRPTTGVIVSPLRTCSSFCISVVSHDRYTTDANIDRFASENVPDRVHKRWFSV